MPTVQRRRPTSMIQGKATQFLALRDEETQVKKRKAVLNTYLSEQIDKFGDVDEVNGHRTLRLSSSVPIGGKEYVALQRQRRVSMVFDEEIAERILREHDIYEQATETLVVLDQDKVYALHQEGKISDEEMDEILVEKETFALVPLTE